VHQQQDSNCLAKKMITHQLGLYQSKSTFKIFSSQATN
jgi:hypothetical protein